MKIALNNPDLAPYETSKDIHVLVAYEDYAAGNRAMALLRRVGRECQGPGRLIYTMWRFAVLADPSLVRIAASEAIEADIILIATHEGDLLPQGVRDWIARWLLTKGDRPLALIAALKHNQVQPNGQQRVFPYLQKVAHYGKIHFIANENEVGREVGSGMLGVWSFRRPGKWSHAPGQSRKSGPGRHGCQAHRRHP